MSVGTAPIDWAASSRNGTPVAVSASVSTTRPLTQETCETATSRVAGLTASAISVKRRDPDVDTRALQSPERRQQTRVLLVGGEHLVAGAQVEAREDRVAPVGRRAGERDVGGVGMQNARVGRAQLVSGPAYGVEVVLAGPAPVELELDPLADRIGGGTGQRAFGPGVQVRLAFQDRKLGAELGGVGLGHDSARFNTLPVGLRGSSSRNTTSRGTL